MNDEQRAVVEHMKSGDNVVVNAVAGSGKSTTVLFMAKETPSLNTIQFTYNSTLRLEIREKAKVQGLTNLEVHTFHSMAGKYYDESAHSDPGIRMILSENLPPRRSLPKMDIVVLDETQDITELYFRMIVKFTKDMDHDFQLLVLGDYQQGMYEFRGSDGRFLTLADKLWYKHPRLKSRVFHTCHLRMSYRITLQMCDFLNNVMLGEQRLRACREGSLPVIYLRNTWKNLESVVVYHVMRLLSEGAKPSDFFILANSVKGQKSLVRKIENALVSLGVPCHVPMFETETVDDKVIDNKVVFCTFHGAKGRERKYVFVTGFDQRYMDTCGRDLDQKKCPNTLYVAATRASECLFLLERGEYKEDRPLMFLKKSHAEMKKMSCVDFKGLTYHSFDDDAEKPVSESSLKRQVTPTDLVKFVPEHVLEEITPYMKQMFCPLRKIGVDIEIPSIIQTEGGFYEEVSDLNGVAIPAMYYDYLSSKWEKGALNVLYQTILLSMDEMGDKEHLYLKEMASKLPATFTTPSEYLYLSNVYAAFQEKLYFKLKQIGLQDYNWITDSVLERAISRLDATMGRECELSKPLIEKTIVHCSQDLEHEVLDNYLEKYFDEGVQFRFTARTDLITAEAVWEIKCVKELTLDHQLQVIIYAWLYQMLYKDDPKLFKLFNIRTNEVQLLTATKEELDFIMISLLQGKYSTMEKKSDKKFLQLRYLVR